MVESAFYLERGWTVKLASLIVGLFIALLGTQAQCAKLNEVQLSCKMTDAINIEDMPLLLQITIKNITSHDISVPAPPTGLNVTIKRDNGRIIVNQMMYCGGIDHRVFTGYKLAAGKSITTIYNITEIYEPNLNAGNYVAVTNYDANYNGTNRTKASLKSECSFSVVEALDEAQEDRAVFYQKLGSNYDKAAKEALEQAPLIDPNLEKGYLYEYRKYNICHAYRAVGDEQNFKKTINSLLDETDITDYYHQKAQELLISYNYIDKKDFDKALKLCEELVFEDDRTWLQDFIKFIRSRETGPPKSQ